MSVRTTRRSLIAATTVALGGILVSACSGSTTTSSPTAAANSTATTSSTAASQSQAAKPASQANQGSASNVVLRLESRTGSYGDVWTQRATDFEKANANVTIKVETFPSGTVKQKVETMAAGGTLGDAYFTPSVWANQYHFFVAGVALDLTDYANTDKIDWTQWYKTAVDQIHYKGKLVAMLDGASPGRAGLFYNKTLFKQAGQSEPSADWDLNKLVAAAQALTKNGVYGLHTVHRDAVELLIWCRAFGGDIYSQDGKTATLTTKESMEGITWVWNTLYKWKCSMPATADVGSAGQGYAAAFAAGKLAMFNSGTWDANTAEATKIDWGLAPLSKGPVGKRGSMAEANTCQVSKQSKNPEVAWQWAKWISNHDSGVLHVQHGATPGGRPDVYGDATLTEKYPYLAVFKTIFEEAMPYVVPANFRGLESAQAIIQGMDPIWLNKTPLNESAVAQVNQKVQQVLDEAQ